MHGKNDATWRQFIEGLGYLSILVPPLLLAIGLWSGKPNLAFMVLVLLLPLLRPLFGEAREPPEWSEGLALALDRLPLVYAAVLLLAVAHVLTWLNENESLTFGAGFSLGLSLWMVLLFSTCVAHELGHRHAHADTWVGHLLAGIAGYPVLVHEHLRHHATAGDTATAAWPRLDESAWRFACRRISVIAHEAFGADASTWDLRSRRRSEQLLRFATAVSVLTATAFFVASGWRGLVLYLVAAAGVWFSVQLITYIQHWGLGDDRQGQSARNAFAWEDDCRLQAWITLNISLHQGHHDHSR
jgi:fatty acid desaturase